MGGVSDLLDNRHSDYYFRQNGKAVFRFAVKKMKKLFETVPAKAGVKPNQVCYAIPIKPMPELLTLLVMV
jgi:3-oxoacyl-[acyl-carrier-protein] synthase III